MGKHRSVTEAGSLRDAVAALYSSDPGEFTERRKALVARAREGNDKALAKTIAGLRKPTRSAWVVNMLVRADRFAVSRMTALGDDLRDAERAVDGARIRELSKRRRELMTGLLQQAFSAANLASPPAALRDEVTSTLTAALADPEVAEQLRAGTLVRAVYRDGFAILEAEDPAAWADASASRSPATKASPPAGKTGTTTATRRPARQGKSPARDGTAEPGDRSDQNGQAGRGGRGGRAPGKAAPDRAGQKESQKEKAARVREDRERAARDRAARDRAEQDQRAREQARQDQVSRAKRERELRQEALAEARQTAADAGKAATAAAREEEDAATSVRALTEELAQARQRHAEARVNARHAQAAQRRAQERLTRLRD